MQLTKSLIHTTDAYIKRLREAGIETVTDLLSYFPRDIEDKSDVCERFSEISIKEKQVIRPQLYPRRVDPRKDHPLEIVSHWNFSRYDPS